MTKKKILELVHDVVGEPAVLVVEYLWGKQDISEFQIAKDLKFEVNFIRSILYKLNNHNLVSYIRRKDKEKGWYISYWTLNLKGFKELSIRLKKQRLEMLKERLKKESENRNSFFMCKNACIRLDFDQAMEYNFRCPECGELLIQQDNSRTINHLKEKIKEIEEKLKLEMPTQSSFKA